MQTLQINVYKFNELNEEAQEKAIQDYRNKGIETEHIYDEAYNTVIKFNEVFETKEGGKSWLDCNTSNIRENVLNLKGLRLRTYILNNFYNSLYKPKYLGCIGDNKIIKHRMSKTHFYDTKKGARVSSSNFIYSNIQKENSCTLTGVFYDDDMLKPIYEFIENGHKKDDFNYLTFEMLLNECFESLEKSITNEIEFLHSDTSIIENIEINDYDFLENGEQFF